MLSVNQDSKMEMLSASKGNKRQRKKGLDLSANNTSILNTSLNGKIFVE